LASWSFNDMALFFRPGGRCTFQAPSPFRSSVHTPLPGDNAFVSENNRGFQCSRNSRNGFPLPRWSWACFRARRRAFESAWRWSCAWRRSRFSRRLAAPVNPSGGGGFVTLAVLFNPAAPLMLSRQIFLRLEGVSIAVFLASLFFLGWQPILSMPSIADRTLGSESL